MLTSSMPLLSKASLSLSLSSSYGKRISTALNPALAARSTRSSNGYSVNNIVRLAANLGMVVRAPLVAGYCGVILLSKPTAGQHTPVLTR